MDQQVMPEPGAREHFDLLAQRVAARFVLAQSCAPIQTLLSGKAPNFPPPFSAIADAFSSNVGSLVAAVTLPWELAFSAVMHQELQRLSMLEGINQLRRELDDNPDLPATEDERLQLRYKRAETVLSESVRSPDGSRTVHTSIYHFLLGAAEGGPAGTAARELILQGLVLGWGAFEVLAREVFVTHLNLNPEAVEKLLQDPVAKRRFDISKVGLDVLVSHSFDLSKKMGAVLAAQQDLSDLITIKAIYRALFAANRIPGLDDDSLRLLSLRRNLVVHRRGVIDEAYRRASGCSSTPGSRLEIAPAQLVLHLESVVRVGLQLLEAAT